MNTALPISDFKRLYRELKKDGDGVKREDMTYKREREEAFFRLGGDYAQGIDGIADKVEPGKHHGVVARARVVMDPAERHRRDMEERKKKMEIQKAIRVNDEFNKMVRQMHSNGGTYDDKFLDKLSKAQGMSVKRRVQGGRSSSSGKVEGRGKDKATGTAARSRGKTGPSGSFTRGKKSAVATVDAMMIAEVNSLSSMVSAVDVNGDNDGIHHTFLPRVGTLRRKEGLIDKTRTTAAWSKEEREYMNKIYWELDRPRATALQKGPWRAYYEDFTSRFLTMYPRRNRTDVLEKVEHLVTSRAFKEQGEEEFWQTQKEGKTSSLVQRGSNMGMATRFELKSTTY